MSDMEEKYYPAVLLGSFADGHAALRSGGISGHAADMIVASLDEMPGEPIAFQCAVDGEKYDEHAQTMVVLLPTKEGRVNLYLGFFGLLSDSREEALMTAVEAILDDALEGKFAEPPVFDAFQWRAPVRSLQ